LKQPGPVICRGESRKFRPGAFQKEKSMATKQIPKTLAYSEEQVGHIRKILVRNHETIKGILKQLSCPPYQAYLDSVLQVSSAELATCLRILDTEYEYVPGHN